MRWLVSILAVLGIVVIGVVVIYLNYGTLDACGILRERVRQQAVREGGQLGSFVATAVPDNVLNGLLAAQYGSLTPGRCIDLLLHGEPHARAAPAQR
ncbi:MAG TPA: hypothetical protein VLV50_19415 [Stellaceae bacterium]|nr:hypothetical protein [Stellaceae bacterium]